MLSIWWFQRCNRCTNYDRAQIIQLHQLIHLWIYWWCCSNSSSTQWNALYTHKYSIIIIVETLPGCNYTVIIHQRHRNTNTINVIYVPDNDFWFNDKCNDMYMWFVTCFRQVIMSLLVHHALWSCSLWHIMHPLCWKCGNWAEKLDVEVNLRESVC